MKVLLLVLLAGAIIQPSYSVAQRTPDTRNASAVEAAKYVGLRHRSSLPDNLKDEGGALISDINDATEYGIGEIPRGGMRMLWFERLTHRDDSGAAHWEVKDVLVLPRIPRNQILVYSMCFYGEKPDKEIVAIADYRPYVEFFTRVRRAWRANRVTEKFEEIPTKGIKCENAGYGV
jgi:hypothetical protein